MAAEQSVSVDEFSFPLWCGRLASALEFALDDTTDPNRQAIARQTLDAYDAALAVKLAGPTPSNVVPLKPPVSIKTIIDDLGFNA